jgi:hypothetical protein
MPVRAIVPVWTRFVLLCGLRPKRQHVGKPVTRVSRRGWRDGFALDRPRPG